MLQKSLRRLTPTTFLLTPKALSATLLLKMNREVFNVAHVGFLEAERHEIIRWIPSFLLAIALVGHYDLRRGVPGRSGVEAALNGSGPVGRVL